MTEIFPNIFLGGKELAKDYTFLKGNRITHILSAGLEFEKEYEFQFQYLNLTLNSDPIWNFYKHFNSCYDFIKAGSTNNNRVYVHCGSGNNRGATAVIAYLLKNDKSYSVQDCLSLMRIKVPTVSPKVWFIDQLEEWADAIAKGRDGAAQPGPNQTFGVTTQIDASTFDKYSTYQGQNPENLDKSLSTLKDQYGGNTISLRTYQETCGPNRPTRDRNVQHLAGSNPTYTYTNNVNGYYNQPNSETDAKGHPIGYIDPQSQVLLNEKKMTRKDIYRIEKLTNKPRVHHASKEAIYAHHDKYTKIGKECLPPKKLAFDRVVDIHHNHIGRRAVEAKFRKEDNIRKRGDLMRTQGYKDGDFGF